MITSSPIESYEISPASFFDGRPEGINLISRIGGASKNAGLLESQPPASSSSPISRFVRTPEGQCIGVMREEGIELQLASEGGTQLAWKGRSTAADNLVVLDKGA